MVAVPSQTFGTAGKAVYTLEGGEETELYEYEGDGCLTHMWFGGSWDHYEETRIRVYVDGEVAPSIDMELFLGHGIGFRDEYAPWGTRRIGKTGQPSGVYNTYRIPFGDRIRVTAELSEETTERPRFWYMIRGNEGHPIDFSGVRLPDRARLKLIRTEDETIGSLEELTILDTDASGMLYNVTIAAESTGPAFLEGCVRAYLDGTTEPLLLSSGLEDYFLGTYYFNSGRYYTDIAGLTHESGTEEDGPHAISAYRFHEEDPVFFTDGMRLTLRNGEETDRERWESTSATYTSYVWVYEW